MDGLGKSIGANFRQKCSIRAENFSAFGIGPNKLHINFEPIRCNSILTSFEIPPKMGLKRGYLAKSASEVARPSCDIFGKNF